MFSAWLQITLPQHTGSDNNDEAGATWDEIILEPVISNYIKIKGVSMYDDDGNPGMREIMVFGNEKVTSVKL